ncbi:MAG: IS21-like element helper ATPase IstB [Candidatus Eisenbacteria bacterium]|uniref:IS21-like element helper ATPase IstB n=1 Tax=Eiseniibacteriota bacterium TaxID=2212470 RepID=A0A956NCC3_UNCEI|nr:IS21-like element helper ATPase IstB [Candidatus Eisenbacteria bacterium]MCB9466186.1 ATP-binding protein [Candidatus Eisenbacteria bacterium]
MFDQATIDKMTTMRLSAMADAFREQAESAQYRDLTFEERFGLLVDAEWTSRQQRKLSRRLKSAQLRYPASIEDVDFQAPRGLSKQAVLSLASCNWIEAKQNVVVTGATGTGKTFLACALVEKACRTDFSAHYVRAPRLIHDLLVARADGSYTRFLNKLVRIDLLAIDDWLLTPLKDTERRDLLEVIEDRSERCSTLIATQLPVSAWHAAIGEPTLADGICDRLLHRAHRIGLKGGSRRKPAEEAGRPIEEEGEAKKKR